MSTNVQTLAEDYIKNPTDGNFKKLYDQLNKRLRFFIWKYVKYQKDANDVTNEIVQITYNKVFKHLYSYNGSTTFVTWVFTIAKREALNYIRKTKRFVSIDDDFLLNCNEDEKFKYEDANEDEPSIDNSILDLEFVDDEIKEGFMDKTEYRQHQAKKKCQEIIESIESLPTIYSILLIDKYINNLSYIDIAIKNNLNLNTVRTRLRKGKTLLNELIK